MEDLKEKIGAKVMIILAEADIESMTNKKLRSKVCVIIIKLRTMASEIGVV